MKMNNRDSEKWLERKVKDFANQNGGFAVKLISITTGLPDRLIMWQGGIVEFVELKSKGCKQTWLQKHIFERLQSMGFKCTIIDSEISLEVWKNSTPARISKP